MKEIALLKAIRIFGSQTALAKALNVTPQQINNWLNRNDKIPYDSAILIEALTKGKIKVEELVPNKTKANKVINQWRTERELANLAFTLQMFYSTTESKYISNYL